ncbi:MAG: ATP-binding cassette domain-containing protein [Peptococcaceae bacterium]|nr:ATP-binding cassette domain-containing protein [Peptococcaceae bacterium]
MKDDPILEAREVSFGYPDGTEALRKVSLSIPRGKKTAFLGPNGAGKTTLFLHFNGILRPAGGKVCFDGRDVRYDHRSLLDLRKNVGIVFQDPDTQLFSASVLQEVSFGPLNLGLPREEVWKRVNGAMAATGTVHLKDRPTHFLSYGQKKRVAIADILAMRPRVLICDEPTAWLDARHADQIMDLFDKFNGEGMTVVFSTHDVNLAYSRADYIYIMKNGAVIGEGLPEQVFKDLGLLQQAGLERPWLVDVYEELKRKGLAVKNSWPKTKEELFSSIAGKDFSLSRARP